jgi:hypothetical protein
LPDKLAAFLLATFRFPTAETIGASSSSDGQNSNTSDVP